MDISKLAVHMVVVRWTDARVGSLALAETRRKSGAVTRRRRRNCKTKLPQIRTIRRRTPHQQLPEENHVISCFLATGEVRDAIDADGDAGRMTVARNWPALRDIGGHKRSPSY